MNTGSRRSLRQSVEDRPIRRTWWLLSGAFVLLAAITGTRALTSGEPLDWVPVLAVGFAALAAIAHRNAVANLEARGRGEAENFARILQGLARSVSVDAIVGAIVDDLAEGTGADHVVVVRRRPEGHALEATLVTRRPGVPNSTTVLPLADLDAPIDREPPPSMPVPIEVPGAAPGAVPSAVPSAVPGEPAPGLVAVGAAAGSARDGGSAGGTPRGPVPDERSHAGPYGELAPLHAHRAPAAFPSRRGASGVLAAAAAVGRAVERSTTWLAGFLDDVGVAHPIRPASAPMAAAAEVIGTGHASAVAARVAERVRSVYALSHTLAAPLRTEDGVIGAIVLSRRDREAWPQPARRLLEGAAVEAAAAMARAYSYREVAAHASTDPLTGLPNRRYFDEFCGLLARRRRSGDAVAVLMVDIDKFKVLNDTYGHPVGDEVLRSVAAAIVSAVREEDVPARVGGEEFAVLLRNPGPEVAAEVGERVRQAVRALDLRSFGVPGVSVSVGVANAVGADEPIPTIVERADQALLRAKRSGRDRVISA
ncbi:MAG: GGDEF domain-containing protein [Chloroflexi bacterium]|nr:GGDEF domain-containing protein [Chloroflexota bacterium]